jgi:hypothetical protein
MDCVFRLSALPLCSQGKVCLYLLGSGLAEPLRWGRPFGGKKLSCCWRESNRGSPNRWAGHCTVSAVRLFEVSSTVVFTAELMIMKLRE